jgi:polar amino acid transport system permease protein
MSSLGHPSPTALTWRTVLWTLLILAVLSGIVYANFPATYHWNWSVLAKYKLLFFKGWSLMLGISVVAMVLSVVGGFILMLGTGAPWEPVRVFAQGYIAIMRGTPLLVVLLLGYDGLVSPMHLAEAVPAGTLLLAAFEAAYLAEIFRGALDSVGRSQREAARAVGFDTWQMYRFVLIPQSVRRALPGMTGELVSLVKSSSLLSIIGVQEITQVAKSMNSSAYTALEGYIPLALAYLVITLPLSWAALKLERRFAYET